MSDGLRAAWLLLCIVGIILRRPFIRSPLGRFYWKHRGLSHWRKLREIYTKHGIELRVP